ncbi:MAG: SDR family oxidoreductase [Alphaproteobacteria bacterium]|nr:SDR family oxidoreductase [Alphaproteobacteria bacterium]
MTHTIVIGGTRGLGREVVRVFSTAGHAVTAVGRKAPPDNDLNTPGVTFRQIDITDGSAVDRLLAEAVATSGPINHIVFCQRFRGGDDPWAGEIAVSLTATKNLIEKAVDRFSKDGDRAIVLVSSVFGEWIGEGQPLGYHVGKAGLNHMMRFFAVNLGSKGIRVNAVTPFTYLKDESKKFFLENQPLHDLYKTMIPLGRMATSEDSARVIVFLCSPAAGFVTGQNITVDGGLSLVWPETLGRKLRGI